MDYERPVDKGITWKHSVRRPIGEKCKSPIHRRPPSWPDLRLGACTGSIRHTCISQVGRCCRRLRRTLLSIVSARSAIEVRNQGTRYLRRGWYIQILRPRPCRSSKELGIQWQGWRMRYSNGPWQELGEQRMPSCLRVVVRLICNKEDESLEEFLYPWCNSLSTVQTFYRCLKLLDSSRSSILGRSTNRHCDIDCGAVVRGMVRSSDDSCLHSHAALWNVPKGVRNLTRSPISRRTIRPYTGLKFSSELVIRWCPTLPLWQFSF